MEVERDSNGGFPEPVAGEPVRLVRCRHDACGASTRVRVPPALPARAIRRVVCDACHQPFDCDGADDDGIVQPPESTGSRLWKYLSIPVAAAVVIVALILIQGSGSDDRPSPAASPPPPAGAANDAGHASTAPSDAGAAAGSSKGGQLVKGSSYTLALPDGWSQTPPQNGQTFAASADDGGATAALWVKRDPNLSFPKFESQSLAELRNTAGSAEVTGRTPAPTAAGTIVTLAPHPKAGAPSYEVTLRVAGPYRYYLATTVEPSAPRDAADGAGLIHSSFVPVAPGKSG
jgi:hypothetical protein